MTDTTIDTAPPEAPLPSPVRWVRDNLFSSVSNTVQTVAFTAVLLGLLRWVLGLVFADESNWVSVATNMRLLFTYNYPAEQFVRIWFAAGVLFVAVGASFAAWNINPSITLRRIGVSLMGTGGITLVVALITPSATPSGLRTAMWVLGVALVVIAAVVLRVIPEPHRRRVPFLGLLIGVSAIVCAIMWFVPFGDYGFSEGEPTAADGIVASSTRVPWTVLFIIMIATYVAGRGLAQVVSLAPLRRAMIAWWVIGPAFIVFMVLRDPEFDWAHIWSTDLPMAAGFALGGGALIYLLAAPGRSDLARVLGAIVAAAAVFNWVAAFFGWYPMLQKARFSFALAAIAILLVPNFAGERSARLRVAAVWAGFMVVFHWLLTGINTASTLDITAPPFLGGFVLTVSIAYYVMLASFPLGVLLSLARTSKLPIFRVLSTTYIEVVRGVPLITVLFFFSIMLPLFLPSGMGISDLAAVFAGYTVFSAAYMAENIRGGLQSVRRGQYEAADALGLTTVQRTSLIVLPQALRVSIPNLVGQAIATFKETSLIAIVGGFDLLRIANSTIPNQPDFLGQKRPALLFISLVYFVVAYTMSRASRNLENRLQAGQAR
ncbi:MAG: amino acid ABC transporter permease [Actinobacteria bacterium]|nr:amino acid ABC transporter permease [Actinomycetota bacterium]